MLKDVKFKTWLSSCDCWPWIYR